MQGAPDTVYCSNRDIQWKPHNGGADGYDMRWAWRLSQIREFGLEIQIGIKERASQLREVDDAIRGHAVRVGELHP